MSVQHLYGLIRQCKKASTGCWLLLLQLLAVASSGADDRFKIQAYRSINGSDEVTAASCWKDVAYAYLSVTWRLNGRPLDFATTSRFSWSTKTGAFSTHFWLQINSPLIGDNGTTVTCQPDGYKESDKALVIVYNFAPKVEAIGDAEVRLYENDVFQPRVRIFFSGGNVDLMYFKNERQVGLETNVDSVYGTKVVSLSPLKILKGMSGPLSVLASLDGLRFPYPIFNLTVISRIPATPTREAFLLPSSYDYSTKSVDGNGNGAEMTSSAAILTSSAVVTRRGTTENSATVATTINLSGKSTPTLSILTIHKNGGELLQIILGVSISGVVLLALSIVALILIYRRRNKFCTRTTRQETEAMQVRKTGQHSGANRAERSCFVEDLANDVMDDQQKENERTREEVRRESEKTREEVRKENEKTREEIRLAEASRSKNGILKGPTAV
ncbi:uncharacterized protein [Oscarella lobularis]|uniref:uncharacterized protein n=1 Tax=Oscarella lobularis TaxID=121494 RepID=UPI003313A2FB